MTCQPAVPKAFAASLPERLLSLPKVIYGPNVYDRRQITRPSRSHGNEDASLIGRHGLDCFLIFRPHPRSDRLLDVFKGFLLILALRNAPGQGRDFSDDPTVFGLFE